MHWDGGVGKLGSQNRELDQDERRNSRLGRKSQRRPASPFAPAVACHQVEVSANTPLPSPLCAMARSCPGRDPSGACTWRSSRRHSTGQFPQASQTPTLLPGRACAYPPIFKIPHIKPAMPGGFHAAEPLRTRVRLNWGRWVYDRACACGLAKPILQTCPIRRVALRRGCVGGSAF